MDINVSEWVVILRYDLWKEKASRACVICHSQMAAHMFQIRGSEERQIYIYFWRVFKTAGETKFWGVFVESCTYLCIGWQEWCITDHSDDPPRAEEAGAGSKIGISVLWTPCRPEYHSFLCRLEKILARSEPKWRQKEQNTIRVIPNGFYDKIAFTNNCAW